MTPAPPGTPLTDDERQLVVDNLGLVHYVVGRMTSIRPDMVDDRIQDGTLGLMRAVQLFDPGRGFTFSTYAIVAIRRAIGEAITADMGAGYREHWRNGTTDQHQAPMHYDGFGPVGVRGSDTLSDVESFANTLPDDDPTTEEVTAATELQRQLYADAVSLCVTEMERDLVDAWFAFDGLGETVADIAERHGMSLTRAYQRRRRLQAKLRDMHYGLTP